MPVNEESFLIHAMRLIIELDAKRIRLYLYTSAITYEADPLPIIDVYYSIDMRSLHPLIWMVNVGRNCHFAA